MIIIASIIIVFLLCLGNFIAYKFFISVFPVISVQYLIPIRIIFLILMLSFFLASILTHYYDNWFSEIFYTFSASWLGFLFYIVLAAILYGIIWMIVFYVFPSVSVLWLGKILFSLAILVGIWGLYNAQNIIVTRLTISIPNLPEVWKGRKAVFLSDIHLGQINGEGFAKKVFEKVKELNPDIIFDGGDLYDGVVVDALKIISPLSNLKPSLGYYFVTGNHEEYGDTVAYKNAIKQIGIHALNDEVVVVDGVNIVGVDYNTTSKSEDFSRILNNIYIDSKNPSILIKHVPFDLNIAEKNGIDLQLSGHTHRAQMWPLNFITKLVYKGYDYGLKNFNSMQVLVTDGVGTWGPPMRVGTHSEIVLITFE